MRPTATLRRRLPGTMPNGHLVSSVPKLLHSSGAGSPFCREAMETQPASTTAAHGSRLQLPPCPASLSTPLCSHPLTRLLLSTHIFSPNLTQKPHPESRQSRAVGGDGAGVGGLSNWHRFPAKHTREPLQSLHRTLILCFPTFRNQPAPPLTAAAELSTLCSGMYASEAMCGLGHQLSSLGRRCHVLVKPASVLKALVTTLRHTSSHQIPKGELLPQDIWPHFLLRKQKLREEPEEQSARCSTASSRLGWVQRRLSLTLSLHAMYTMHKTPEM